MNLQSRPTKVLNSDLFNSKIMFFCNKLNINFNVLIQEIFKLNSIFDIDEYKNAVEDLCSRLRVDCTSYGLSFELFLLSLYRDTYSTHFIISDEKRINLLSSGELELPIGVFDLDFTFFTSCTFEIYDNDKWDNNVFYAWKTDDFVINNWTTRGGYIIYWEDICTGKYRYYFYCLDIPSKLYMFKDESKLDLTEYCTYRGVYNFKLRRINNKEIRRDKTGIHSLVCNIIDILCYLCYKQNIKSNVSNSIKVGYNKDIKREFSSDNKDAFVDFNSYIYNIIKTKSYPNKYLGGHHVSPKEHIRRGYYRRVFNKDGSLKNIVYVNSTIVNKGKDKVVYKI